MGISINAQRNKDNEYVKSVTVMKDTVYRRTIAFWKLSDILYLLSKDYWREKRAIKVLHDTTDSVIRKRRQFLLENPESDDNTETPKKRLSFIDILLKGSIDGRPLTDREIREQVDTFMFEVFQQQQKKKTFPKFTKKKTISGTRHHISSNGVHPLLFSEKP